MAEVLGTEFNEEIDGTEGDDVITGFSGYDTMDGGEGSDTYVVHASDFQNRYVDFYIDSGTTGTDTILAAEAGVIIGIGDGFSYASSGIEIIDGLSGSTISGDNDHQVWDFTGVEITGVDVLFGMGGHDEIRGSEAGDTIDGGLGHDVLNGGRGNDTVLGGDGHDQLFGDEGRDTLSGGTGNDSLFGGAGRDFLNGNEGYDTLDGGEGSDVYLVGLDNAGFVDTYMDSGDGDRDVIRATEDGTVIGLMTGFGPDNGIEVITAFRNADVTIGGTNDAEVWDFSNTTLRSIQSIDALDGHDTVIGSAQRNIINAGDGNDYVDGGAGNDILNGGNGYDVLLGGLGRDQLNGGSGDDKLDGGAGNDLYLFYTDANGSFNEISDSGDGGKDRIIAKEDDVEIGLGVNFDASNGIEVIHSGGHDNVTLQGRDNGNNWDFSTVALRNIESINSGDGMDVVHGSNQANTIFGEGGHDQLYGGRGADTLYGGDDSDFLYGENGRDTLHGEQGHDILDGGKGRDILFGGVGHDILIGGLGRDTMTGGEGFDIFAFGPNSGHDVIKDFSLSDDKIDLRAFDGEVTYDDLKFVQGATGLTVFMGSNSVLLENVFLGSLSIDSFLLPEVSVEDAPVEDEAVEEAPVEEAPVEEPAPADPDAKLIGDWQDNTLEGGSGNDYLFGDSGNDTLIGGAGDDELFGSHNEDVLLGGDGDDMLDGGNDADKLDGGDGNDILLGDSGTDVLVGGNGDDKLDGGNDDDLLYGGDGNDSLEGFNGRDTLDGGAGNDTLSGFNDADILTGGTGDDMLTGGWGQDTFVFSEGDGHDTITDFENYNDTIDLSTFGLSGFADLNLYLSADNTVILELSETQTIEFANVSDLSVITEDDFIF